MKRRTGVLIFVTLSMGALILDSRTAMEAAADGVDICIRTVIPSLFPFFVLSIFLTGSLGDATLLQSVCRLFQVSSGGEGALISGLLGGYPVGAQAAAEAFRNGRLSREGANRLLMFCSQAGPSFLFGIAAAQFSETRYGWMLWAVQLISAWTVARLMPGSEENSKNFFESKQITITDSMKKAVFAIASVCGWVVIFRVFLAFLNRWVLWFLPETVRILISGLLELTNGCLMLSTVTDDSVRFILAAVMLNFGGICVLMQTASVAQGLDLRYYIRGKLLQTILSLLFGLLLLGNYTMLIPIAGIFLALKSGKLRKNSSNPAMVGV